MGINIGGLRVPSQETGGAGPRVQPQPATNLGFGAGQSPIAQRMAQLGYAPTAALPTTVQPPIGAAGPGGRPRPMTSVGGITAPAPQAATLTPQQHLQAKLQQLGFAPRGGSFADQASNNMGQGYAVQAATGTGTGAGMGASHAAAARAAFQRHFGGLFGDNY